MYFMKKYLICSLFFLFSFPVLATKQQEQPFQERLYCKVSENAVRVYLLPEEGTLKCLDYVSVVNSYLKTEYNVMMQIIANRNRWDDLDYRDSLYEEKKEQFLKLFSQRTMIKKAMTDFEEELLTKSKWFLEETLQTRLSELNLQIEALNEELERNPSNYKVEKSLHELEFKESIVEELLVAETMDTFLKTFSVYLTLFPFSTSWK